MLCRTAINGSIPFASAADSDFGFRACFGFRISVFGFLALLSTFNLQPSTAQAQGTAFTYQGRLQNNAIPASGTYSLQFALYASSSGGGPVAGPVTNSAVVNTNGLFTVIIDFGAGPWCGETTWLQIGVETNGGSGFTTLSPRQQVTPVPVAITAENLCGILASGNLSGSYGNQVTLNNPGNQFSGSFAGTHSGNGGGLTNVNASTLNGLAAGNFWQLTGNNVSGGQFLGSLNNQAIDIRADNERAFRLEPTATANSPNVIGGSALNSAANAVSATIGGGYLNNIAAGISDASIGGGYQNTISGVAHDSAISGGIGNTISGGGSFIGGGGSDGTTFAGNQIQAPAAAIGGGLGNQIQGSAFYAFIGGGKTNSNAGNAAAISGGLYNSIQSGANDSTISGGQSNLIDAHSAAVDFFNGQPFLGAWSAVDGGLANTIQSAGSFIGGGFYNLIDTNTTFQVVFSNGQLNNGGWSVVAGGAQNTISAGASFIGSGGFSWIQANAQWSFIGGGEANVIDTNCFVSTLGDYGILNLNSLSGGFSFIGGGATNTIRVDTSVIGGGVGNLIDLGSSVSVVGGGLQNSVSNTLYGFIGGGAQNSIRSVPGGDASTIVGGIGNMILAGSGEGFIGGGSGNIVNTNGSGAVIAGGSNNKANGVTAMIPGGEFNVANGRDSLAAGNSAEALFDFSFVWSDNNSPLARCTGPNQFIIGSSGGAAINTHPDTNQYIVSATYLPYDLTTAHGISADYLKARTGIECDGSLSVSNGISTSGTGTFNAIDVVNDGLFLGNVYAANFIVSSDRNLKEHFAPVDPQDVLARVAALPITRWNFKADQNQRHIGPMAQDFYAAFNTGPDDRHIGFIDEGGVALAAIQGLNQKLEEELHRRDAENAELKARLERLEELFEAKKGTAK